MERVVQHLRRILAGAVVVVLSVGLSATPSSAYASHSSYDGAATARVDAHRSEAVETVTVRLNAALKRAISPATDFSDTFTTLSRSANATNTAKVVTTGQEHHVISRRVAAALDDHPTLAGQYSLRYRVGASTDAWDVGGVA
jgi:hypothetical protein